MEEKLFPAVTPEESEEAEDKATEAPAEDKANEEQAEESKQETLILGKFKSVDDLAKAYKELEKKLGKDSSEMAALKKELGELRKLIEKPQPKVEEDEQPDKWLERFYQEGPKAVDARLERLLSQKLAPLQEKLAQLYYQQQIASFQSKYKDFDEYRNDMADLFEEYPELSSHPKGLEFAYRLAKAKRLEETLPTLTKQAAEEAEKSAAKKQAARMPGSGKPAVQKEDPEQAILKAIFGEGEKKGIFG